MSLLHCVRVVIKATNLFHYGKHKCLDSRCVVSRDCQQCFNIPFQIIITVRVMCKLVCFSRILSKVDFLAKISSSLSHRHVGVSCPKQELALNKQRFRLASKTLGLPSVTIRTLQSSVPKIPQSDTATTLHHYVLLIAYKK